jgi:hypothetical protein
MSRLSQDEIAGAIRSLDDLGYAVVRGVVSAARLDELSAAVLCQYEAAVASGRLFKGGGRISGHLNFHPGESSRFVFGEIARHGVIDVVRCAAPRAVERLRVAGNLNLPGSVRQHYHTDGPYTDDFLICNVALVDTDVVNGAIDVLAGTHKRYYPYWQFVLDRLPRLSTRLPLAKGDVLLRRSNLWHRGMPNLGPAPRPMVALTFGEKSAPDGDPFQADGGHAFFFPNWYGTNLLGRIRERTFVTAPVSYSAYRFVRSLYGRKGYDS